METHRCPYLQRRPHAKWLPGGRLRGRYEYGGADQPTGISLPRARCPPSAQATKQ